MATLLATADKQEPRRKQKNKTNERKAAEVDNSIASSEEHSDHWQLPLRRSVTLRRPLKAFRHRNRVRAAIPCAALQEPRASASSPTYRSYSALSSSETSSL
ncbi:hypothetical protein MTO96_017671 [Rhipicephalus appendiculatus]